jgi:hypothetical protein
MNAANFNANSQEGRDFAQAGHGSRRSARSSRQIVDDVVEKAKNQATGFENGLVMQFRSLANNKAHDALVQPGPNRT